MPKILKFDVPMLTAGKNREFCVEFNNAYLTHSNPKNENGISCDYVSVFHNNKKVLAGIDKQLQISGNSSIIYDENVTDFYKNFDIYINDEVCLIHDDAGVNYQHFFFCLIGRLYYFDELRKNRKIKLGIIEDFYENKDNCKYIKEWFDLFYENDNVEIIVFKKNTKYKIKTLILPNSFYSFPQPIGYDYCLKIIKDVVDRITPLPGLMNKGVYISRQDTVKRKWNHNRYLKNELELISRIQNDLKFDIVELMDLNLKEKIQLFKSYKYIIQTHGAGTTNILFSNKNSTHFLIENPKNFDWLTEKCINWCSHTKSKLKIINNVGKIVEDEKLSNLADKNNIPWKLSKNDIDTIVNSILYTIKPKKIAALFLNVSITKNNAYKKYSFFADNAVNSFKKWHPNIDIHYVNDDNFEQYLQELNINEYYENAGILKIHIAKELMKSKKYDKIINIGVDTITCDELTEFLDNDTDDMICTSGAFHPIKTIYWETPTYKFITNCGEFVDVANINGDVICINNINSAQLLYDISLKYWTDHAEQGGMNYCYINQKDLKIKVSIVDFPYNTTSFLYNVRSKGVVGGYCMIKGKVLNGRRGNVISDTYPTLLFYVENDKLYTKDKKQIKLFHYCESLGGKQPDDELTIEEQVDEMKNMWFNSNTIDFFQNKCDCKF